jgi:ABC-type dipeptide/oligopeptide/nickel transport system permease subunit
MATWTPASGSGEGRARDALAGAGHGAPRAPRAVDRAGVACALRRFSRRRIVLAGSALVVLAVGMAVGAPVLTRHDPNAQDFRAPLDPPGWKHLLGTDDLGRDILSRIMYGARVSLRVSVLAVALAAALGVTFGLASGYLGGRLDNGVMRVVDSLLALPPLVLALLITAVLGAGLENAMIAIAAVAAPTYTRLMRGQVLAVKHNEYVVAAQASGAALGRILVRHILPNSISPIIVQASLGIGGAIITESSLSFIGLGAQPPAATWGSMVQVGFQYLETAPWFVLAPSGMIFLAVLGFNLLGDGLRDAFDPGLRG